MIYTDTHFHLLTMVSGGADINTIHNLHGMDIGTDPHDIEKRLPLINRFPGISFSIGAGPWCVRNGEDPEKVNDELRKDLENMRPAFLGEIGLDYFRDTQSAVSQKALFEMQLDLASEYSLPVVIHNRDASDDVIEILESKRPSKGGIIHCFSADEAFMKRALDLGFMISFSGTVTYRRNTQLRDVLTKVPDDALLLETDSPYLTPEPLRGRPNDPGKIIHTYERAASERGCTAEELAVLVRSNFESLLAR